jgi:hypothetical protein
MIVDSLSAAGILGGSLQIRSIRGGSPIRLGSLAEKTA